MSSQKPVCIVTGASRGIGAATAKLAAQRGYQVVVNFYRDEKAAQLIVSEIATHGGVARAIQADISQPGDVSRLFETTVAEMGIPVALVNNAVEPGARQPIEDLDLGVLRRVIAVNLEGALLCIAHAVRRMSTKNGGPGGAIVNLSSQATLTGGYQLTPYIASKAGMEAVTMGLARELGPQGIRVNIVSPGLIATGAAPLLDDTGQPRARNIPLGRFGTPEEVAETILWLLSPAASYVTGTLIPVTGGR